MSAGRDSVSGGSSSGSSTASATPALSGTKRYKKGRSFADTLFGKLRYGKDLKTGKWVAIKENKRWFAENKISLKGDPVPEDLEREIRVHRYLMSQPDCPISILKLLDVVSDDVYIYLIFELVQNGDLFTFIQESHKSMQIAQEQRRRGGTACSESAQLSTERWIANIGRLLWDVVSAVGWLHSQRVCHLDISLENALIDSQSGRIKVIDFGLARLFSSSSESGFRMRERCGKSRCMAPEVNHPEQWYDARSADVWSIGVMFFMMLLGVPAWNKPDCSEMIYRMVIAGRLRDVIIYNRKRHLVSDDILDLLCRFFKAEAERVTVPMVEAHPFVSRHSPR